MACEDLEITPIVGVIFYFYINKPAKGNYVFLGGMLGKCLFMSHSNHYKNWRDKFARVRGREGFLGVLGADDALSFP